MDASEIYNHHNAFKLTQSVRDITGSVYAATVYEVLFQHASWKKASLGKCRPSLPLIAHKAKIGVTSTKAAIAILTKHRFIEVKRTRKPNGKAAINEYTICDFPNDSADSSPEPPDGYGLLNE